MGRFPCILTIITAVCLGSCGARDRCAGVTPESVGAVPLSSPALLGGQYGAAAGGVMKSLHNPGEFFVTVERGDPDILVFHLWHRDAFKGENAHMIGNPGGRCRDVHYSVKDRRVVRVLFWQ
ncbi:MAG: hypothetical protein JXA20_06670 [Spirochaetes bacterium]|nr:hypothetical protein [Spirochaetota bacterium]